MPGRIAMKRHNFIGFIFSDFFFVWFAPSLSSPLFKMPRKNKNPMKSIDNFNPFYLKRKETGKKERKKERKKNADLFFWLLLLL